MDKNAGTIEEHKTVEKNRTEEQTKRDGTNGEGFSEILSKEVEKTFGVSPSDEENSRRPKSGKGV
jgi:hypothetical protein